jgi:excisionase family DNA binding protein
MLGKKNDAHRVLEVDASLQGDLVFKDAVNLHINGKFEGTLETKGDLLIGEHAEVKANIRGERIAIAGRVEGDILALSELKITSTARVTGNIESPVFTLERGGIFQGLSRMLKGESPAELQGRRAFLNLDEVARYLSVETGLISEWAKNGKLPASREGEDWRFDKQRIDEWIANGRIT